MMMQNYKYIEYSKGDKFHYKENLVRNQVI